MPRPRKKPLPGPPLYDPATGPSKPLKEMTPEERTEYHRQYTAHQRAKPLRGRPRLPRRPGPKPLVRLSTRLDPSTSQRRHNAAHALGLSFRELDERAYDLGLLALEIEHNRGLPFPDPPATEPQPEQEA